MSGSTWCNDRLQACQAIELECWTILVGGSKSGHLMSNVLHFETVLDISEPVGFIPERRRRDLTCLAPVPGKVRYKFGFNMRYWRWSPHFSAEILSLAYAYYSPSATQYGCQKIAHQSLEHQKLKLLDIERGQWTSAPLFAGRYFIPTKVSVTFLIILTF